MQQPPKPGPNAVAEYQLSSLPFATASSVTTSSVVQLSFPYVTRFLTVKNTGTGYMAVGFTSNGVQGTNRFTLPPSGSETKEFRLKDLFLLGVSANTTFEVVAGLTMIESRMLPTLTGSAAYGVASASSDLSGFGYAGLG